MSYQPKSDCVCGRNEFGEYRRDDDVVRTILAAVGPSIRAQAKAEALTETLDAVLGEWLRSLPEHRADGFGKWLAEWRARVGEPPQPQDEGSN